MGSTSGAGVTKTGGGMPQPGAPNNQSGPLNASHNANNYQNHHSVNIIGSNTGQTPLGNPNQPPPTESIGGLMN